MPKQSRVFLFPEEKERLMCEALAEAEKGMREGEAPIGSVLALPDKAGWGKARIVARGHNRVNALQRKMAHAEIITFENAGGGSGNPPPLPLDAEGIILVSTLEPCVMCYGAAVEAGVSLILFGLEAPADNGTRRVKPPESPESTVPDMEGGIFAQESRHLFEVWLKDNKATEQSKFVRQLLALTASGTSQQI